MCFPRLSVKAVDFQVADSMCNSRVCCVATVKECVQNLSQEEDKENLVASLWGAERCLRVLESVSTAGLICQTGFSIAPKSYKSETQRHE